MPRQLKRKFMKYDLSKKTVDTHHKPYICPTEPTDPSSPTKHRSRRLDALHPPHERTRDIRWCILGLALCEPLSLVCHYVPKTRTKYSRKVCLPWCHCSFCKAILPQLSGGRGWKARLRRDTRIMVRSLLDVVWRAVRAAMCARESRLFLNASSSRQRVSTCL